MKLIRKVLQQFWTLKIDLYNSNFYEISQIQSHDNSKKRRYSNSKN